MRSTESEGESIDQAIDKALRTLQVERDQVEVEILTDATRGLFGFGGTRARVRATVRAPLVSGLAASEGAAPIASRETPRAQAPTDSTTDPPFDVRCRSILAELLSHLGVSCSVEARPGAEPGTLMLDVNGDNGGLLIGRRGQTLDAIEYIVNRIAGRGEDGVGGPGRVMIDVEHYRERRAEYLTTLARRLADKAKESGRVVTLNPMSPRDRRLVHIALKDDSAIVTRSQGDGHYRKILILPADRGRKGPRSDHPAGR
jgi:spoIIIJ-associated protein